MGLNGWNYLQSPSIIASVHSGSFGSMAWPALRGLWNLRHTFGPEYEVCYTGFFFYNASDFRPIDIFLAAKPNPAKPKHPLNGL